MVLMYLNFRDRLEVVKTKKKEVLIGNPKRLLVTPYGLPLLLPGEMNILQIQCKIDLNTFLLRKPHIRCIKCLRTMLVVHVGWLLGIPGHHW